MQKLDIEFLQPGGSTRHVASHGTGGSTSSRAAATAVELEFIDDIRSAGLPIVSRINFDKPGCFLAH